MNTTLTMSRDLSLPSQSTSLQLGIPVSLLLLAALSVTTIDAPLSRHTIERGWADEVHQALSSIEPFGGPYGMAVVLIAIVVMSPARLLDAFRIGSVGVAGGLSAGILKLLVSRERPHHFDFERAHVLDSFQGILPFMSGGGTWQSFPSAHTATAVAFAVGLAYYFPRARWLCYSLAALVGLQRIEDGQHFASDVLVGAAVGWTVAKLILTIWKDRLQRTPASLIG